MSLWNPRRPLNQPPHYGQVTPQQEQQKALDATEQLVRNALYDSRQNRGRRADLAVFDKSTKGSR